MFARVQAARAAIPRNTALVGLDTLMRIRSKVGETSNSAVQRNGSATRGLLGDPEVNLLSTKGLHDRAFRSARRLDCAGTAHRVAEGQRLPWRSDAQSHEHVESRQTNLCGRASKEHTTPTVEGILISYQA